MSQNAHIRVVRPIPAGPAGLVASGRLELRLLFLVVLGALLHSRQYVEDDAQ